MITRHGYYIPAQNLLAGDEEFAQESKRLFDELGFTPDKDGRYQGGRYDGVSIHLNEKDTVVKRVCLEDLFSTQFRVIVKEYPLS